MPSYLDQFNRADEALNASTDWLENGVSTIPNIESNVLVGGGGYSYCVWEHLFNAPAYAGMKVHVLNFSDYVHGFGISVFKQRQGAGPEYDQDYTGVGVMWVYPANPDDPEDGIGFYRIGYGGNFGGSHDFNVEITGSITVGDNWRWRVSVIESPDDSSKMRITGWVNSGSGWTEIDHVDESKTTLATTFPTGGVENLSGYSAGYTAPLFDSTGDYEYDDWEGGTFPPSGGTDTTDSGTLLFSLIPSSVDVDARVDAAITVESLIPSAVENKQSIDASTSLMTLSLSSSENKQSVDTATEIIALAPSSVEVAGLVDSQTVVESLIPSSADIAQFVDAATVIESLIHSGTDDYTAASGGTETTDSATLIELLSLSRTENAQFVDSATGLFVLSSSSSELYEHNDAATGLFTVGISSSDIAQFVEAAILAVLLNPSSTDIAQFVELSTLIYSIVFGGSEGSNLTNDVGTLLFSLIPSSTELIIYAPATPPSIPEPPTFPNVRKYVYPVDDPYRYIQQQLDTIHRKLIRLQPSVYPEAWHYVGTSGEPAFQNSWENYGSPYGSLAFMLNHGGMVHLAGAIKTGSTSTVVFTLPSLYRPSHKVILVTNAIGTGFGSAIVDTDGTLTVFGTPPFALDGSVYRIV